jgi:hypothetical protein
MEENQIILPPIPPKWGLIKKRDFKTPFIGGGGVKRRG